MQEDKEVKTSRHEHSQIVQNRKPNGKRIRANKLKQKKLK